MSARSALTKFYQRQLKGKRSPRQKKNGKPELEVRTAIMRWLKDNGFSCHVIEAKAVYNFQAGRYVSGQTEPGVADIFGVGPNGVGVFIELKAPGRRSTLKPHQREFLVSKINVGAFAACLDSVSCLETVWTEFEHRRKMEPKLAIALLMRHLPPVKEDVGIDDLFERSR